MFFLFTVSLLTACKSQPSVAEIEIKEPEFGIVSIFVIQADLINTRFETVLRIDNPNEFAVELPMLKYELYGNGIFWAGGTGTDVLHIPPHSSCQTKFSFSMNFINMNRGLLDDVIAMRQVRYRFKGEARVQPGIVRVPAFTMNFDCSGLSEVRQRLD